VLGTLALAGCGADRQPATTPRVQLKLAAPGDGRSLRAETVEVSGTVTPAFAAVTVSGERAEVNGGTFTATVSLQPGGNVIDITATATGRRPAADAVRVTRDMRVELPALVGHERDAAFDQLEKLGLKPQEKRDDTWLDRLIPGDDTVCATSPPAATLVQPGAKVTVEVARNC
jgi:hypothetical protein